MTTSNDREMERSVVIAKGTGLQYGSFSSSYSAVCDNFDSVCPELISEVELFSVIQNLNEAIQQFWPCHAVYFFGVCCAPCSLGLSLMCPNTCIGKAEEAALRYLEQASLKATYYDRGIRFRLVKSWFSSRVELSFPFKPENTAGSDSFNKSPLVEPPVQRFQPVVMSTSSYKQE